METPTLIQQWLHTLTGTTLPHRDSEDGVVTSGEDIDDLTSEPRGGSIDDGHLTASPGDVHPGETINVTGGELTGERALAFRQDRNAHGCTC